jgi:hypothetical protein
MKGSESFSWQREVKKYAWGASETLNLSRVVEIGGLDQGIGHLVSMTTKQTHS